MIRRLLTAAIPLMMLAACGGMPEEGDDLGSASLSIVDPDAVASTNDPVPANPPNAVLVPTGDPSNPVVVVTSSGVDDLTNGSSTTDPVPAKIRRPGDGSSSDDDGQGPGAPVFRRRIGR